MAGLNRVCNEGGICEDNGRLLVVLDSMEVILAVHFQSEAHPGVTSLIQNTKVFLPVVESGFPDSLKIAVVVNALILRYLNLIIERE